MDAITTIPAENHNPRLNPKIIPAMISPKATKELMVKMERKKEKSLLLKNATALIPAKRAKVSIPAWLNRCNPPSLAKYITIAIKGTNIKASARIYRNMARYCLFLSCVFVKAILSA